MMLSGFLAAVDSLGKMPYNYSISSNSYAGGGRRGWASGSKLVGTN
jgi:hypothetical protein